MTTQPGVRPGWLSSGSTNLSNPVMPNIGAFIRGLITALFMRRAGSPLARNPTMAGGPVGG